MQSMRDCVVCGTKNAVTTKTGRATCPACQRARKLERKRAYSKSDKVREQNRRYRQSDKYREVKRRYVQSEKGKATARAREEREDVREKRRQFSRSPQGRRNKAKYESTEKGRATRSKAMARYRNSEHGKQRQAEYDRRVASLPHRIAVMKRANEKYAKSEKMKAKKRRDYARRKGAIVPHRPVTANDWLEIQARHNHRCAYCGKQTILTMDHVIPVSKGGKHVKENIVPACLSCNARKNNKLIRLC